MICQVLQVGLLEYERAWRLQEQLAAEIAEGSRLATLLLLEHPHTYTFGRRGQADHLLWDAEELRRRGISVHWVDRGGDVTYHGPGQLVGYPLIPLAPARANRVTPAEAGHLPQADYVGYLRRLEQVLIVATGRLGLQTQRLEGMTGVWVPALAEAGGPAKIAAIGVKVDARGVTRHGFALNVHPDMEYWQGIIGCGLEGFAVTSLAEQLQPEPTMKQVLEEVVQAFGEVFEYEMAPSSGYQAVKLD